MRATPRSANQTVSVLSKMVSLAIRWGLRQDRINPCRGAVDRFVERRRGRLISSAEYARLGSALAEAERTQTEHPTLVAFFRLAALSGCRLSEIRTLRWENVNEDRGIIHLPETKTGEKVVEITAPVAAVLSALPKDSEWALPALTDASKPLPVGTVEKAWTRIRAKAELADLRIHDLRHGYGATGVTAGVDLRVLQTLLGHATITMTQRYAAVADDPRRDAAAAIAGKIAGAMNGAEGEVVELARRNR